jgi:hypothetical protein
LAALTTTTQQTALERPVATVIYFAAFDFTGGVIRLCTYNSSFDWGGYTWLGIGGLGGISQFKEKADVTSDAVMFTLNVTDASLLAVSLSSPATYRGRAAVVYHCPLTPEGTLIDAPEVCWRGQMDMVNISIEKDSGQILLKCETTAFGLKRVKNKRMNAAQQSLKYPTDTGFDMLTDLIANPVVWLSKKFQQV